MRYLSAVAVLIAAAAFCPLAAADDCSSNGSGRTDCTSSGPGGNTTEDHTFVVTDTSQDTEYSVTGSDATGSNNGGDVLGATSLVVESDDPAESFRVHATGGEAEGGIGGSTGTVQFETSANTVAGGLSASTNGGAGFEGGDAGDIVADLNGTAGEVKVTSRGGGGTVGGDGGDLTVAVKGDFEIVYISTKGAGDDGRSGDIDVVLTGTIGSMMAESGDDFDNRSGGTVRVVLADGAAVAGTLFANNESASSVVFQLSVADRSEFQRATRAIANASAVGGTLTIGAQSYAWQGFDQLVDMLNYVGRRENHASVEVTVEPDRAPSGTGKSVSPIVPLVDANGNPLVGWGFLSEEYRVTEHRQHLGADIAVGAGTEIVANVSGSIIWNKCLAIDCTDKENEQQAGIIILGDDGRYYVVGHVDTSALPMQSRIVAGRTALGAVILDHVHWGISTIDPTPVGDWGWGRAPEATTPAQVCAHGWIDPVTQRTPAQCA